LAESAHPENLLNWENDDCISMKRQKKVSVGYFKINVFLKLMNCTLGDGNPYYRIGGIDIVFCIINFPYTYQKIFFLKSE
jgi:hypothetical protein